MDYKRPNMRAQPEGMAFYKDINEFLLYVIKGKLHPLLLFISCYVDY